MNTYTENKLRKRIEEYGQIEITIVPFGSDEAKDIIIKTDYFDEAKSEILEYENGNEVYF